MEILVLFYSFYSTLLLLLLHCLGKVKYSTVALWGSLVLLHGALGTIRFDSVHLYTSVLVVGSHSKTAQHERSGGAAG